MKGSFANLKKVSLVLVTVALIAVGFTAASGAIAKGGAIGGGKSYLWSAKYTCGVLRPFANVIHWTEIEVQNPGEEPVEVIEKFILDGTQDRPAPVDSQKSAFKLGPNEAVRIECDEIADALNLSSLGRITGLKGFVEIVSKQKLSVVAVYDKCTRMSRVDVFPNSQATVTLTITGDRGADVVTETVELSGPTVVRREARQGSSEMIETEILSMELRGISPTLGAINVSNSVKFPTFGTDLEPGFPSGGDFPIDSFFDVFVEIDLGGGPYVQGLGHLYNVQPVKLKGKLTQVPPGHPDREGNNVYIHDGPIPVFSSVTGTEVGVVSTVTYVPNPPGPVPPTLPPTACSDSSVDVEYIDALMLVK